MRKYAGYLTLLTLIAIMAAITMTSGADIAEFHIGETLRILGIIIGLTALYLIGKVLWFYIKHPPSKEDPFGTGPIAMLKHRKQRQKLSEITAILNENDPDRFLRELDAFFASEKISKGMERVAADNRAVAYLQQGKPQRAIEIWVRTAADEKEARERHKIHNNMVRLTVHYNLAYAYLENGQTALAREHYAIVQEMQNAKYFGSAVKAWILNALVMLNARLLLAEGRYEEARELYQRVLQANGAPERDMDSQFGLAAIYEALGDTEKQKEHLERVAAHGNQHDKARIAREKLAEITLA